MANTLKNLAKHHRINLDYFFEFVDAHCLKLIDCAIKGEFGTQRPSDLMVKFRESNFPEYTHDEMKNWVMNSSLNFNDHYEIELIDTPYAIITKNWGYNPTYLTR